MTIPKSLTTFVVLTFFIFFSSKNVSGQEYNLNTSQDIFWPAPSMSKPNYREEVNDPTFNSKITRVVGNVGSSITNISSQVWRNVARHGYSVRQPWNADESVLYLGRHRTYNSSWGPALFVDGETYEPISTSNQPSGNEHRWHPTDPSLRLILTDNSIITWNFYTNTSTTLMTFSGYSNTSMGYTGNWSDDANKIAMFATRNSDGKQVVFALDIANNIKYPDIDASSIGIDYVSISPLGNYILINGNFGDGSDRTKIYDLNGNQVGPYWSEYGRPSHFDMAIDQNGDEVAVGVDKANGQGIIKRRLSDGQVTSIASGTWGIHTSGRALNRPGWVYASTSTSSSWGPRFGEIIAVKLDGTRVERICHARNEFSDYQNEAHPCPSPSGGRIIFATDWGNGNVPIQAYVADFRHLANDAPFSVNAGANQTICEGEETTLSATGADSYLWNTNETTATITVSPTETTTYTVTGTDSEGNEASDSVTVTVNPIPNANAGGDVEICQDHEVSLTATGGNEYLWNTGETTSTIVVQPNETTTYSVTVTTNGCSSSDDVVVTVKPRPTINAGNDVDIYQGESTTLTAVGDGSFEWSTGETTETITVSPNETTTYTVTALFNGCTNSDSVTVIVNQQDTVVADAGDDVEICENDSVTLSASGGDSYLWSTGETTQSITVSPNQTTTYTVTVSNQYESDSDQVVVYVYPIPIADAGEDATINYGESTTLTASGGSNYLWSTGQTTQSISVSPTQNRTYTVEVFESSSCSSTDTVDVTVYANANAGDDITICQGESTMLTASGGSNFLWNTGETSSSINVSPDQTTTYSVIVSNGNSTDEDEVTVHVNLLPNAYAGEDNLIEAGQSVTLGASGGNSYLWSTGESSQYISVSPLETTTYTVEAIINGCSSFDEVTISVVEPVNAYAGVDIEACPGEEITLTASGGLFYEWNTGETSQSITVIPNETTEFSVTVSNGINSQTDNVVVSVEECVANIEHPEGSGFEYRIYPNPSQGELNVRLSGLETISSIYVSDMMGKVVITESFEPENGLLINKYYNLSSLAKGIYFVTLYESGKEAIVKKLILQ